MIGKSTSKCYIIPILSISATIFFQPYPHSHIYKLTSPTILWTNADCLCTAHLEKYPRHAESLRNVAHAKDSSDLGSNHQNSGFHFFSPLEHSASSTALAEFSTNRGEFPLDIFSVCLQDRLVLKTLSTCLEGSMFSSSRIACNGITSVQHQEQGCKTTPFLSKKKGDDIVKQLQRGALFTAWSKQSMSSELCTYSCAPLYKIFFSKQAEKSILKYPDT